MFETRRWAGLAIAFVLVISTLGAPLIPRLPASQGLSMDCVFEAVQKALLDAAYRTVPHRPPAVRT